MSARPARWIVRGAVTLALVALVAYAWANRGGFAPVDTGVPAPPYGGVTLNGDTVSLADLRGRVVLLNVWATWCQPCVREMPALEKVYRRYALRGLTVLAVSVDQPAPGVGGSGPVREFVHDLGLTFPVVHDPSGTIEREYQVAGYPSTFVIGRDGRIHERVLGWRQWDDDRYAAQIEKLLGN